MKIETNVFGQRICSKKECPAWYDNPDKQEYGQFCQARLSYRGRIAPVDGKAKFGELCLLPIQYILTENVE